MFFYKVTILLNKRVLFYFICVLFISFYVLFVWAAGEDTTEGLYSIVINNITSGGTLLNKLNITTGENLNFTCTAEKSNLTSLNRSTSIISNISFYHNFNTTNIALNMTNTTNSTSSYYILQQNSSLTSLSALFKIANGTITYNANGGWSGTSSLDDGNFTIACAAATNNTGTFNYSSNITLVIDRIQPNFSLLNITDGTKTVLQASLNGTSTATANAYLTNSTNLTLRVTITEPFTDKVKVFWTTNNTPVSLNDFRSRQNPNNLTLNKLNSPSASNNLSVFNGSFLVAGGSDEGIISLALLVDGTTVNFMLVANDTAGNIKNFSNGGAGFNITIDGKAPSFSLLNVTDGTNTVDLDFLNATKHGGAKAFLRNESELKIRISVTDPNIDAVKLYWSTNGTPINIVGASNAHHNPNNLTMNKIIAQSSANNNISVWNGSFRFAGTGAVDRGSLVEGTLINFLFVANDSAGNILNFSNGGNGFNLTLDNSAPSVSFVLDKTRIEVLQKITAACSSDDNSSANFKITLTKPSGNTVVKSPLDGNAEFSSTDTGEAGNYEVSCEVSDSVSLSSKKTLTFSAYHAGVDAYVAAAERKVAEVDLSRAVDGAAPEGTIRGLQGESTTFTLDGETKHSLTFLQVSATSAQIRFESTPVDITLNLGETKEVDLDGDGDNDVMVTLVSTEDEEAIVTIKPTKVPPPRAEETVPTTTTPAETEKPSRAGVIVVVLLILAVVVAAYFLLKKGNRNRK